MDFKQFRNYVWGMYGNNTISRGWELYKQSQHALWMARAYNAQLMKTEDNFYRYLKKHQRTMYHDYATPYTLWVIKFENVRLRCREKAKEFK